MRYISNAFGLGMLRHDAPTTVRVEPVTVEAARDFARWAQSVVDHADTAALFSAELGVYVVHHPTPVRLEPGDELLMGQYVGVGARVVWLRVEVDVVQYAATRNLQPPRGRS